jgi:hypothetical protein
MIHIFAKDNRLGGIQPRIDLGTYTIQFIQFHFHRPRQVLREIDDVYIDQEMFRRDLADITFLRQERLNADLYRFLLGCGYSEKRIAFVRTAEKVNVTPRRSGQRARNLYTPELVTTILRRDRLLFKMFPQYMRGLPQEMGLAT